MIFQKESSTDFIDAMAYAQRYRQSMIPIGQAEDYVAVHTNGVWHRENVLDANQVQTSVADASCSSIYELVSHMRYLESEVGYLKEIVDAKSLWLDASIEEIYGDWV